MSLEQIRSEAGGEIEIVVADGGTEGLGAALARDFGDICVLSEPDSGIYDGMNRGLARSSGEAIWFLNGGDTCVCPSWTRLRSELMSRPGELIFFSYELAFGSRTKHRTARQPSAIWHGLPTSHQAIFFPGDVTRRTGYDLRYSMSADYALTATLLRSGVKGGVSPLTVARFEVGGHSTQHAHLIGRDAAAVQRDILDLGPLRLKASAVRHYAARNLRRARMRFSLT